MATTSKETKRWVLASALLAAPAIGLMEADARVGGGGSYSSSRSSSRSSSYSRPSSSSGSSSRSSGSYSSGSRSSYSSGSSYRSGSSYSSGSSGSAGEAFATLVVFLIVCIVVIAILMYLSSLNSGSSEESGYGKSTGAANENAYQPIIESDANFSEPAFLSFANLLFARFHVARGAKNLESLAGYFQQSLLEGPAETNGLQAVEDVIVGNIICTQALGGRSDSFLGIRLRFEACYVEKTASGTTEIYTEEDWTLSKQAGVLSKAPEDMLKLGCPSCGNSSEIGANGVCPFCTQVVNRGNFQWLVTERKVKLKQQKPPLKMSRGGAEVGTDWPTVMQSNLATQMRAFEGRHPGENWDELKQRVVNIFLNLQDAWSNLNVAQMRPYETDVIFDTHRFWLERYKAQGLRNVLADVKVTQLVLCRIDRDAFYERLTFRVFAQMRDWTQDRAGKVVSGDDKSMRRFSEYWTFIKRIGGQDKTTSDLSRCPNCGAEMNNVNQQGVCEYCDTKISSGNFDWVLCQIDQDESYGQAAAA